MAKRVKCRKLRVKNHPIVGTCRIEEHRLVAAEKIGRRLRPDEVAHHKDRNRRNNRPSNIVVMTKTEHDLLHTEDRDAASRAKNTGRKLTPEHRAKVAAAMIGNKSRTGQKLSLAERAAVSRFAQKRPRLPSGRFAPLGG